MFSREGQEAVVKDGYMPLPAKLAQQELAKISGVTSLSSASR